MLNLVHLRPYSITVLVILHNFAMFVFVTSSSNHFDCAARSPQRPGETLCRRVRTRVPEVCGGPEARAVLVRLGALG